MHLMSEVSSSCEDFGDYAPTPRSSCVCSAEGTGTSRLAGLFATLALLRSRTRRIRRVGGQHGMATYQYRCVQDGVFEVSRPIGTATPTLKCPICHDEAVRVFRAPMLSLAPRAQVAAIDRTEKSRDEPEVVSSVPPRAGQTRRPVAQNPAWQHLPRP